MTEQKGYIKIPGLNLCAEGSGPGPARAYVKLTMILFPDITNSFPCSLGSWFPPPPACAGTQCKEISTKAGKGFFPMDRPGDLGWGWSTETQTHHNSPQKMGARLVFCRFYLSPTRSSNRGEGEQGSTPPHSGNGMKSTKIRKPIYNIIAVNY